MSAMRAQAKPNLLGIVQPQLTMLQSAALVVLGAFVLTLAAKARVPFYPVPMTLQTLAIGILAASVGARLAGAAVLLYLAEGAIGFPVFTNTPPAAAGLSYFMGPTGGYLLGFLLSALIIGTLADRGWTRSFVMLFVAMVLGDAVVLALGTAWLAYGATLADGATGMGLDKALAAGLYPFLLGALVKEALGAAVIRGAWSFAERHSV